MDDTGDFLEDADLVAQTLAGEREAFGQLYDRYARLVRAVAFGAGRDLATVQDLTQETFLRAFRQLATLRQRDRFGAWVVGIARQVVREQRRCRRPEPLSDLLAEAPDNTTAPAEADEVEHVLHLVRRLPEQERLAVQLFYLTERDANETARLLNRSRSGTYALLKKACARLARWLGVPAPDHGVRP
jgi:RNA polymerase sigma-70 factor (ECF subfamily)